MYRVILPSGPMNGTACAKFAFAFWDDIFGSDTPSREVTSPTDIRPGDLLQFPGHWAIATERAIFDDFYQRMFVNNVGGGASGMIGWASNPSLISDNLKVYTRYPLPYKFEDSEVHLTTTAPIGTPFTSLEGLDSVRLEARKAN